MSKPSLSTIITVPNVIDVETYECELTVLQQNVFSSIHNHVHSTEFIAGSSPIQYRLVLKPVQNMVPSGIVFTLPPSTNAFTYSVNLEGTRKIGGTKETIAPTRAIAGETTLSITHPEHVAKTWKYGFVVNERQICASSEYMAVCCCGQIKINFSEGLKLTCTMKFFNMTDIIPLVVTDQCPKIPTELAQSHPMEGFGRMYLNPMHSDVTLCVAGTDYPAHKVVLTVCSKVFEAMFEHDMEESKQNRVEIKDVDEKLFLEVLRYMYIGQTSNIEALACDLLPLADRYDIKGLKVICENALNKSISTETVVKMLVLADSCNAENMKTRAIQFIAKHSNDVVDVMSPEDWQQLCSRPMLSKDVMVLLMRK